METLVPAGAIVTVPSLCVKVPLLVKFPCIVRLAELEADRVPVMVVAPATLTVGSLVFKSKVPAVMFKLLFAVKVPVATAKLLLALLTVKL